MRENPWTVGAFVAATALWVVFQLQDPVLIGLGRADWVMVENVVFGIIKIVLLIVLASALPDVGIFASWTLPLIVVVVAVNVLVFRRIVPRHVAARDATVEHVRPRDLGRYLTADYFASLLWTATTSLLPLIVLAIDGAKQSAYFYLSWTIAYTLYLLSRNLGMSLVTEGARAPHRLYEFALRTLAQCGKIVVPLAVATALLSPLILRALRAGVRDRCVRPPAVARPVRDPQRRDRHVPRRGPRATPDARGGHRDRGDVGERRRALRPPAAPVRVDRCRGGLAGGPVRDRFRAPGHRAPRGVAAASSLPPAPAPDAYGFERGRHRGGGGERGPGLGAHGAGPSRPRPRVVGGAPHR